MLTLGLSADLVQLSAIRSFVVKAGHDLGLDDQVIYDLQLAVDEACTNIVQHGYGGRGGKIEITLDPVEEGVRVMIHDWGAAFDLEQVPEPDLTAPLEERRLGGLGLYFIHRLMDHVAFRFDCDRGNCLTMVKRFPRREA